MIERDMALIDCVKRGDIGDVEALLEAGADPNALDFMEGVTALALALRQGGGPLADLLLRFGATPPATGGPPALGQPEVIARVLALALAPAARVAGQVDALRGQGGSAP